MKVDRQTRMIQIIGVFWFLIALMTGIVVRIGSFVYALFVRGE